MDTDTQRSCAAGKIAGPLPDAPRVSVIMSVYDAGAFLRKAIESILGQSFADFEFIIIDDGSADDSGTILNSCDDPRIRVARNDSNIGLTLSLNKGLSLARGEFVARQDADDISMPDRLQKQVRFLESHPCVGLAGTGYFVSDSQSPRPRQGLRPLSDSAIRWWMMFQNAFIHSSVMFRRSLLESTGLYDGNYRYSQDYDLWNRLLRISKGANLEEPLVTVRGRKDSLTETHREEQKASAIAIGMSAATRTLAHPVVSRQDYVKLVDWCVWKLPASSRFPTILDLSDLQAVDLLLDMILLFVSRVSTDEEFSRRLLRACVRSLLYRVLPARSPFAAKWRCARRLLSLMTRPLEEQCPDRLSA